MSDGNRAEGRAERRAAAWWISAAGVLIVAVIIAFVWAVGGFGTTTVNAGAATPSASASSTGAPSSTPSPSTTPDPSPSPTVDDEPVATPTPRPTEPPVDLETPAEPVAGLTVQLSSIEAIEGTQAVPGEVAGPALLVTVQATNAGTADALTSATVVNLYYGADRRPANILVSPRQDFPQVVPPGGTATGIYAFSVPLDQRGHIIVEVDFSTDIPVVLFEGAL